MKPSSDLSGARRKRVAIIQSSYIPWKGYFDIVNMVDEFILYDDRQFTRRDWRNRNLIKTSGGLRWLTVPVMVKGRFTQRIDETVVSDPAWPDRHWKSISQAYAQAPFFDMYADTLRNVYAESRDERLSDVNRRFLTVLCGVLSITTRLSWSTDYPASGDSTARLVDLCRLAGASEYLSGPAARAYLDEAMFRDAGIGLTYMDYDGYPEYKQLHGPFEHGVSVIDLLFNTGPAASRYMKSFGSQ